MGWARNGVKVRGGAELRDGRRHLQTRLQHLALVLHADVARPLEHTAQVAARLDRAADAIVALDRAEEGGVLRLGDGLLGSGLGLRLRLLRLLPLRRHRGYSLLGGGHPGR